MTNNQTVSVVRDLLEAAYARYHNLSTVQNDPLRVPRRYDSAVDQEATAFMAASFAFGKASQFLKVLDVLLERLGPHPADVLKHLDNRKAEAVVAGIAYRFVKPWHVAGLLLALGHVYRREGSLQVPFLHGFSERQDVVDGMASVVDRLRTAGDMGFLVPDPGRGSACKRLLMFLRWMVRDDGIDLGLWKGVPSSHLLMPLDTHVHRVSVLLGLLPVKSRPSLEAARALTSRLSSFDAEDPVRFDFALAHIGISLGCKGRFVDQVCPSCPLFKGCSAASRVSRAP